MMKLPLLACLLLSALLLGGCETVVNPRRPVVYDRPGYPNSGYRDYDRPREYYYRDGRRYERDVVVQDRVVVVAPQPRLVPRGGRRVIVPKPVYSDRDDRNRSKKGKNKKSKDGDHDDHDHDDRR